MEINQLRSSGQTLETFLRPLKMIRRWALRGDPISASCGELNVAVDFRALVSQFMPWEILHDGEIWFHKASEQKVKV